MAGHQLTGRDRASRSVYGPRLNGGSATGRRGSLRTAAIVVGLLTACGSATQHSGTRGSTEQRVQAFESSLTEPSYTLADGHVQPRMRLRDRMTVYQVPGVSIAVINQGRIEWARGYGVTTAGGGEPVTTGTVFQAGSISKPLAATGALMLVDRGVLRLDDDVRHALASWRLPESDASRVAPVTIRNILSHCAGFTVHGFSGYEQGQPLPTLTQVLGGLPPANSEPIRIDTVPGTRWRYSGGGYTVLQQIVVDATGRPFESFMEDAVLATLGMRNSTFRQPLPSSFAVRAARGHTGNGEVEPGGWHTYREMAAAGLWTTPSDLARFAIALHHAWAGDPGALLARGLAKEMLTRQCGHWGLGLQLEGDGSAARFEHAGRNVGFTSQLIASVDGQWGAVVMTNGYGGTDLIREIVQSLAAVYGWPGVLAQRRASIMVATVQLDMVTGTYRFADDDDLVVTREGTDLFTQRTGGPRRRVFAVSATEFFYASRPAEIAFLRVTDGKAQEVEYRSGGEVETAHRIGGGPR